MPAVGRPWPSDDNDDDGDDDDDDGDDNDGDNDEEDLRAEHIAKGCCCQKTC